MTPTIWHNPSCSTSRHVLGLLAERGAEPKIVEYLKTPPSAAEIGRALEMIGAEPDAIVRLRNAPDEALAAWRAAKTRKAQVATLAAHPILIERPIVIAGKKAALVRPKADAEAILDKIGL